MDVLYDLAASAAAAAAARWPHVAARALAAHTAADEWAAAVRVTPAMAAAVAALALLAAWLALAPRRSLPVYLLSFHCFRPPDRLRVSRQKFLQLSRDCGAFDARALEFQEKMVWKGGLGDDTYLPDAMHVTPPAPTLAAARAEAEMVMFACVEAALAEAGVAPKDVDAVVVNCSLFNPTPSLSAMVVNHFKMRRDVVAYSLGGMGCSAGVIAIALAKELLQTYPNSKVLVVSMENITQNWYFGNERSMLIPNCLFRVGGTAAVLGNARADRSRAKYVLEHVVRTHMGSDDASHGCVYQVEDGTGEVGVHLSKDLMSVAGHALKANITALGPRVLPLAEKLKFAGNFVARKILRIRWVRPYTPDFSASLKHVCIHTGGRGVIDEMEKQLRLAPATVAPSRDTLARYGNTSSSSIWYILARIESTTGIRRGERVWQIAFGSGFKCNSAVWRALRTNACAHTAWAPVEAAE